MLIAQQKKEENIAEYLLYMWQVEDLIRAYRFDINEIRTNIINSFDQSDEVRAEFEQWYENLIEMMKYENIQEKGHLQINKNVVLSLDDLHRRLLKSPAEALYIASYYQTLPYIVELRSKGNEQQVSEIETCFVALYGILMLKLQNKPVTPETDQAVKQISRFIANLAAKYKLEKEGKLEIPE